MLDFDSTVYVCEFDSWPQSVPKTLTASGVIDKLAGVKQIIIKPNLVEILQPPITTPVECVEEIVAFFKQNAPAMRLIVAEGCGAREYDTLRAFDELGYTDMAGRREIELMDLNTQELVTRRLPQCSRWPEMHLPRILFESFVISVPQLKAHSLASVTLSMKNMMGCAPPSHYQKGGHWKKASFHNDIQNAVLDLNRYRRPDFVFMDATVGMQEAHLWGPTCNPPHNKLVASFDPVANDIYGAKLLGREWRRIGHIKKAAGEIGRAEPFDIVEVV